MGVGRRTGTRRSSLPADDPFGTRIVKTYPYVSRRAREGYFKTPDRGICVAFGLAPLESLSTTLVLRADRAPKTFCGDIGRDARE